MISNTKLNKFEDKRNSATEASDTESQSRNFAALLKSSVPQAKTPACKDKSAKKEEAAENASSTDDLNLPGNVVPVEIQNLCPSQNNQNGDAQNLPADSEKILDGGKNSVLPNETIKKDISLQPADKSLELQAEAIIKKALETGKAEVIQTNDSDKKFFSQDDSFSLPAKSEFSNNLPKFFSEVSNIFKDKPAEKSNSQTSLSDSASEISSFDKPENADQIKLKMLPESDLNFNQPSAEKAKPAKFSESAADFSAIGFNKVLDSFSKEKSFAENASPVPVKADEVFEQVRSNLLQLISLDKSETEKKVMKMRLHPAELGTIEIKLERNSSGKLLAHFQTESETTKQILSENLDQLRGALQNSGWQVEHLEISCGSFSSAEHGSRENNSRQSETVENPMTFKTVSGSSSDSPDGSGKELSNRLLSVRA